MQLQIIVATQQHSIFAEAICEMMQEAAKVRGTGIAKRKPAYIRLKIKEGKAVIALDSDKAVGFCYIESWENEKYVANSGLIVHPDYRKLGLAKDIKKATFQLSKKKFPNSKLFGITTSSAVMKINSELGYKPVGYSELTTDEKFWKGCQSCTNFDILQRTNQTMCMCTAMVCDLKSIPTEEEKVKTKKSWRDFFQRRTGKRKKEEREKTL
ncbi:MAG: N-acetylglutamate synthase-like GNAT family acetyltransferase [Flammeovirgaceae bacterium]|jgi:N-acetylglutamate synthase-like GNAT family acetyltransferase